MGAFNKLFGKAKLKKQLGGYFQMLDGYTPVFSTYDGGVYEMELTRSCIHTFANHCSKLLPVVSGANARRYQTLLDGKPNPFMTAAQFVYKVATIYDTQNTCVIVPILDAAGDVNGYYPVYPQQYELVDLGGEPYLRCTFPSGEKGTFELRECGIVSKYLYHSDIKGEDNTALRPTLQLLEAQREHLATPLKCYDPFLENHMVTESQMTNFEEFLENIDLVVIMVKHQHIRQQWEKLRGKIILDCHNICPLTPVYHI